MRISSQIFEAYLKCPTKCFLQSRGECGTGNAYANWTRIQNESFRQSSIELLANTVSLSQVISDPPSTELAMTAQWCWAVNFAAAGEDVE